jgi:flagellin
MIINHNLASLNTLNALNRNQTSMSASLQKLSSGLRINSAADDAAGLAISEKMRGQISGLGKASSNADDAISLLQTAEGALDETTSILQRMRELAVQASTDTLTASDKSDIQAEFTELTEEIDRIAKTTQFNTKNLLDGTMSAKTDAVANVSTNTALSTATCVATTLAGLADTAGNSLGITACTAAVAANCINPATSCITTTAIEGVAADTITVSYVKDGAMCTISLTGDSTMTCVTAAFACAGMTLSSGANGEWTVTASTAGSEGAIYGLTFTVTDSDGNENLTAQNALSAWTQTTSATDARSNGSANVLIGANTGQNFNISINAMDATSLGVNNLSVSTTAEADVAIKVIDTATAMVSAERGKMGAEENRLQHTINNLTTSSENITAAESRIRDVDMAAEMATYTKHSVIGQAATAMLAQANQLPEQVLSLLK